MTPSPILKASPCDSWWYSRNPQIRMTWRPLHSFFYSASGWYCDRSALLCSDTLCTPLKTDSRRCVFHIRSLDRRELKSTRTPRVPASEATRSGVPGENSHGAKVDAYSCLFREVLYQRHPSEHLLRQSHLPRYTSGG